MGLIFSNKPSFLIIGAQKAGTTSLQEYLCQHPKIKCAKDKEVGFFSYDMLYERGYKWYSKQFSQLNWPGTLLFEATPEYLFFKDASDRILQFDPLIKLIILLRNPVSRALSSWNMYRQFHQNPVIKRQIIEQYFTNANHDLKVTALNLMNQPEFPDFDTSVTGEIQSLHQCGTQTQFPAYVQRGIYWEQIERYFSRFPHENILIIESDELKASRHSTLNRVLYFLGLPAYDWSKADLSERHTRSYESQMKNETESILKEFFRPHNLKLYSMIGREFKWP
jgi:hypothetical protein